MQRSCAIYGKIQNSSSRQPSIASGMLLYVLQHMKTYHTDKIYFFQADVENIANNLV